MERLTGRAAGVALHWAGATLLVLTLAASSPGMARGLAVGYAVVAGLWLARTALAGPMARPGSALTGAARAVHLILHRGLLALVAASAAALAVPALAPWRSPLVWATLGAAGLHVAFNLWRAARGEKRVFARMLPR